MHENHFSTFYPKHQKGANLPKPTDVHPRKSSQLQGALPPDPLTRGSVPGPRWRLCPHTPVIASRSALAMGFSPQSKIPGYVAAFFGTQCIIVSYDWLRLAT